MSAQNTYIVIKGMKIKIIVSKMVNKLKNNFEDNISAIVREIFENEKFTMCIQTSSVKKF